MLGGEPLDFRGHWQGCATHTINFQAGTLESRSSGILGPPRSRLDGELDPEGFGGWYLSQPGHGYAMGGLPPAADCGCCHLGSGRRVSLGKWGRLKHLPGIQRPSHRILSTLSALLLLFLLKNRRFPRPAARRGRVGTSAHDVLLNQPWGRCQNQAQGCFCRVSACRDLRGPESGPEGGHPSDPLLRQGLEVIPNPGHLKAVSGEVWDPALCSLPTKVCASIIIKLARVGHEQQEGPEGL